MEQMFRIEPNEADLTDVLREIKSIPVTTNQSINDRIFWCEQAIKEIIKDQELTIKKSKFDKNKRNK